MSPFLCCNIGKKGTCLKNGTVHVHSVAYCQAFVAECSRLLTSSHKRLTTHKVDTILGGKFDQRLTADLCFFGLLWFSSTIKLTAIIRNACTKSESLRFSQFSAINCYHMPVESALNTSKSLTPLVRCIGPSAHLEYDKILGSIPGPV
jgi:hypothetical protein